MDQHKISIGMRLGLGALKDLFSSVNNRVNGYEHTLARRAPEFRQTPTNARNHFTTPSGCGAKEAARRQRQLERIAAKRARVPR